MSMRGVYTSAAKITGLNAAKTIFLITAPSNKVVEIIAITVTNESNATNQQNQVALQNITTLNAESAAADQSRPLSWPAAAGVAAEPRSLPISTNAGADPRNSAAASFVEPGSLWLL